MMKRFVLGFTLGAVLATVTTTWAGYFYSAQKFFRERGGSCGQSFSLGYVAGVYDLMAGLYPVSGGTLGDIETETVREILTYTEYLESPAAYMVVRALVNKKIITPDDALRVIPETWRQRPPR